MKEIKYIFTIIFIQNTLCTIDISIPEYEYLSKHLTPEECRRLYASLHFVSYDFPASATTADKTVPKDIPCFNLLLLWDKGKNKWEGRGKTHVDVQRRLRQIGKPDLAEWLDRSVFLRLQKETIQAMDSAFSNDTAKNKHVKHKHKKPIGDEWTVYDSIIWVVTGALFSTAVYIAVRLSVMCIWRRLVRKDKKEDTVELLSYGSVDSDQETIYECAVNKNIRRDATRDNNDV